MDMVGSWRCGVLGRMASPCAVDWMACRISLLWGGAGAPGGTVRRAAVRKRGPGSVSLR